MAHPASLAAARVGDAMTLKHGPVNDVLTFLPSSRINTSPENCRVAFITYPGHLGPDEAERIRDQFLRLYEGTDCDAPRLAILSGGLTITFDELQP